MKFPAIFFDRDGILIKDVSYLTEKDQVELYPDVAEILRTFKAKGYKLIGITNQSVVARGGCDEERVKEVHQHINEIMADVSGTALDDWYYCPHHPDADVDEYRVECDCRKPAPGMLNQAALDHEIDCSRSFMLGDRMTDIIAGATAGCRTILIRTGKHGEKAIVSNKPVNWDTKPDYICDTLAEATEWILSQVDK